MKKKRTILMIVLLCVFALAAAIGYYVNDYYRADDTAMRLLTQGDSRITVTENERIVFAPEEPQAGLIFYPGAKVQFEAYAPLMQAFAEKGVLCVLVHMPFNLAVLDSGAASGITQDYPEVEHWYLGGHSLGGAMAASYASKHGDAYEGLILLAAYSTKPIPDSLRVLSVYGSEDKVLNMESYRKYRQNLPEDVVEYVIKGGCHAYFGSYGAQDGDGSPSVSREEQMQQTADAVEAFLKEGN